MQNVEMRTVSKLRTFGHSQKLLGLSARWSGWRARPRPGTSREGPCQVRRTSSPEAALAAIGAVQWGWRGGNRRPRTTGWPAHSRGAAGTDNRCVRQGAALSHCTPPPPLALSCTLTLGASRAVLSPLGVCRDSNPAISCSSASRRAESTTDRTILSVAKGAFGLGNTRRRGARLAESWGLGLCPHCS